MGFGKVCGKFLAAAICVVVALCGVPISDALGIDLPSMGINAMGYSYWGTALPFVDVAHMGSQWITGQPTQVNSAGYPIALAAGDTAQGLIFTNNGGIYPTGQYTLQWKGSGDVTLTGPNLSVVSSQPQKIVYNVSATDTRGLVVNITRTDSANPVKGISVRAPFPNAEGATFNPAYVQNIANYGVIRNMGFNSTNNSTIVNWSERTTPTSFAWGGSKGVPYEYQIQLSNELKEDLWVNVPHLASDDYVRNLAQLVKQNLAPGLRVWVEYSNEVWNYSFTQAQYADTVLKPQFGVANSAQAYGRRAAQVFDIFSAEITDSSKLVRVIAGQNANSNVLEEALTGATVGGKLKADVAAVAPYFMLDIDNFYSHYLQGTVDLDSVFAELHTSIDNVMADMSKNQVVAVAKGLPLIGYEGGQHIVARPGAQHNDQGFVDLISQLNRDDRMGQLYTYMLEQWYNNGGKTFTFAADVGPANKWGDWGLQESYLDTNAVKYRAVQQYLLRLKSSASRSAIPFYADLNGDGIIDAQEYVVWRKSAGIADLTTVAHGSAVVSLPEPGAVALAFGALYISVVDVRRLLPRY